MEFFQQLQMSFIYIINIKGPRIDPWGTPDVARNESDLYPLHTTVWIRLVIYEQNQRSTWTLQFGNSPQWKTTIARYVLYLLLIKGARKACVLALRAWRKKPVDLARVYEENKCYGFLFAGTAASLVSSGEAALGGELLLLLLADLIVMFPDVEEAQPAPARASSINYGTGMACSYLEGYLMTVLPGDGAGFVGLEDNIRRYEDREGIVFPVKKLFLVITKTLYCPTDLKMFNIPNRDDLPFLEAMKSLEDVTRDVAGVKNRQYRNSAYQIRRAGAASVPLVAECASPLHTLHRVLEKKHLYEKLADACVPEIVHDFCTTLESIVARSQDCRGKCQLVYFDNEDPTQNLAQVLLDKVAELEPNFEEVIAKGKALRGLPT